MTESIRSFPGVLARIHGDEEGMEAVQTVMIVGIAAVILVVLWNLLPAIQGYATKSINDLKGKTPESLGAGAAGGTAPGPQAVAVPF